MEYLCTYGSSVGKEGKGEMTKSELNKYRNMLAGAQTELVQAIRNRDGIAIEQCPDSLDQVQHATERDLAIRSLDRDSNLLRNVRAALDRIEEGSFGLCLHCEEEISPKRLAAVPSTAYCIVCQELADRSPFEEAGSLDELVVNAA
jgi:DnaK suppressor protein